jgi:hypothetical protein
MAEPGNPFSPFSPFAREWDESFRQSCHEAELDERERCRLIFTNDSSDLRPRLARHLAFATDLSAEESLAVLRAAPVDPSLVTPILTHFGPSRAAGPQEPAAREEGRAGATIGAARPHGRTSA